MAMMPWVSYHQQPALQGDMMTLLGLLKLLWPFLREAIFGNASVKAWAKRNFTFLLWLTLMAIMLGIVFRMAYLLNQANGDLWHLQHAAKNYATAVNSYKGANEALRSDNTRLQNRVDGLIDELKWVREHYLPMTPETSPPSLKTFPPLRPGRRPVKPTLREPANHGDSLIDDINSWNLPPSASSS